MLTQRETDWGLPLPGDLLPPERHSETHLIRLPLGRFDAAALFGRVNPLVVDLGCGNGRWTIIDALARPSVDHLAVDVFPGAIRHAVKRANRRGLTNVRFAVADAADVVRRLADHSTAEVHLYHPQPIYDLSAVHKRLITPPFLLQVHRILVTGGVFVLQTDHPAYWDYLRLVVPLFFTMDEQEGPWPDAPAGRTRREILARQLSLPVFRAICRPRGDLALAAALVEAEHLPLPRFDATRRLEQADEHEASMPLED